MQQQYHACNSSNIMYNSVLLWILCYYESVYAKQSTLGAAEGKLWGELGRNCGLTTSRFSDVSAKHLITFRI